MSKLWGFIVIEINGLNPAFGFAMLFNYFRMKGGENKMEYLESWCCDVCPNCERGCCYHESHTIDHGCGFHRWQVTEGSGNVRALAKKEILVKAWAEYLLGVSAD